VDHSEQSDALRKELSGKQRTAEGLFLTIDPGFVHRRKIETILGPPGMELIDRHIQELPDLPEALREVRIDRIYTRAIVNFCDALGVHGLRELLNAGRGRLFSSVEVLEACPEIFGDQPRMVSRVKTPGIDQYAVELRYSRERVRSDTLRSYLHDENEHAIIARFHSRKENLLVFEPLVMGAPWLWSGNVLLPEDDAVWWSHAYGEVFVEDIDELAKAVEVADAVGDWKVMEHVSEQAFKQCLAEILGVDAPRDWGGERSDLYSAHVHLRGRRHPTAFLLKGPARFSPMTLNHLGKNNDQIVRLSHEPADLLIVQHCHDIGTDVRETLRAFAVQPGPIRRRYCLIDGRDSYKILLAYGKLDRAKELSRP
jgi:hypothetical protein